MAAQQRIDAGARAASRTQPEEPPKLTVTNTTFVTASKAESTIKTESRAPTDVSGDCPRRGGPINGRKLHN